MKESVSQYIFVLALVFLGAVLAELAGIEGIIGAFLTGLSLNKLIPSTSSLMNRIEFVGNAIFIPFFLISVGMLVDYRAFFRDFETIKVAAVMTGVAISPNTSPRSSPRNRSNTRRREARHLRPEQCTGGRRLSPP